jgi:hypothetical protein
MDFISSPAFEVVQELPRELKNSELLGRRFYTDLKKRYPKIDSIGEPSDWSRYTIRMDPYLISFATLPLLSTIRYRYSRVTNKLDLHFEEECLPLEVRTLTQHFFKEIEQWQKRKNKKQ